MRITILGVSGFIGRHLKAALEHRGDTVASASLRKIDLAVQACADADVVVNLAGASVAGKRWTPEYKEEIRRSRTELPRQLIDGLAKSPNKPQAYVSASAVGYYGTSETATFTEKSAPGSDFLAQTSIAWENEALRAREFGMRVAIVRTGIVLGLDGGALAQLMPIFKLGGGGNIANGEQWYSWIHIDDQVGVYLDAIDRYDGILNATAPAPVRNKDFTRALAAALHRPAFLPVPAFALQLLFGEGADVVTKGQRVLPEATLASGYVFKYPEIDGAMRALVG